MTSDQRQALEGFAAQLRPGGKVLYCPGRGAESAEETGTPGWFRAQGFNLEVLDPSRDLRLFSLGPGSRGSYDGIWAGRVLVTYPIEDTSRVIATFFQALRPKAGVLFAAIHEGSGGYSEKAWGSLLRQNGFQTLLEGRRDRDGSWIAVITRRI